MLFPCLSESDDVTALLSFVQDTGIVFCYMRRTGSRPTIIHPSVNTRESAKDDLLPMRAPSQLYTKVFFDYEARPQKSQKAAVATSIKKCRTAPTSIGTASPGAPCRGSRNETKQNEKKTLFLAFLSTFATLLHSEHLFRFIENQHSV